MKKLKKHLILILSILLTFSFLTSCIPNIDISDYLESLEESLNITKPNTSDPSDATSSTPNDSNSTVLDSDNEETEETEETPEIKLPSDKLLIIESIDNESASLCAMLDSNLSVSVVNVKDMSRMPTSLEELKEYGALVLCNVSNSDLPDGFDEIMHEYVQTLGGGLFTVCGNKEDQNPNDNEWEAHAFTREDMYGSLYQEMLPVEIIEYTPPVAVVIIIDSSGSMYDPRGSIPYEKSKLYAAKLGAEACLGALTERDWLSIMTFSDYVNEDLEFTPCTERDKILDAIESAPQNGGETRFAPALASARASLISLSSVEKRHIIIVTDGEPSDAEEKYGAEIKRNADAGITMSIVGVDCFPSSQKKMIFALETYGNGSSEDFHNIPMDKLDTLPSEMRKILERPEIKDTSYETFLPTIKTISAISNGIDPEDIPTLDGFYGTKLKSDAVEILSAPYAPIYAQWTYGSGKVGSFCCDLNGTFSMDFINSSMGAKIINNIIKDLMPDERIPLPNVTSE